MSKQPKYSDKDLNKFKKTLIELICKAKEDLELLQKATDNSDSNDTSDTQWNQKMAEENIGLPSKEEVERNIQKQKDYIKSLQNAMVRVENKSYGICAKSGELIPRERLDAMPTATTKIF